eukprot:comp23951_c0_seq1/m.42378 comp23951_c0_seq1/g.42378  ORF comp23951_c0_seq1/g.42378 comp23951_c0_seq1/m.42378 type:complete len:518 (-) comp23951_c0_seq1:144-1697(-)
MKYVSTRGGAAGRQYTFEEAVLSGLAEDGGLHVSASVPNVTAYLPAWQHLSFPALCAAILAQYVAEDEIPPSDLASLTQKAFGCFGNSEVVHVHGLDGGQIHVAELWHGPTIAFKDLGLQMCGRVLDYFLRKRNTTLTLLIGTSGDTGSAAIEAVCDLPTVDIVVIYPVGRVTHVQEGQILHRVVASDPSHQRQRVHVVGVEGTSDDLDRPITAIFNEVDYKLANRIGSVNSINILRILVQQAHYFYSYFRATDGKRDGPVSQWPRVHFAVPTGACGNIVSGIMARLMGLPIESLCAATNNNQVVQRMINTGDVHCDPSVFVTSSSAMDIQVPYNIERLLYYASNGNTATVSELVLEFYQHGHCSVPKGIVAAFGDKLGLSSVSVGEEATWKTLQDSQRAGYLVDPHTAVGLTAAQSNTEWMAGGQPIICLACAHPAKFVEVVSKALDIPREQAVSLMPDQAHPSVSAVLAHYSSPQYNIMAEQLPPRLQYWARDCDWLQRLKAVIADITATRQPGQ